MFLEATNWQKNSCVDGKLITDSSPPRSNFTETVPVFYDQFYDLLYEFWRFMLANLE